MKFIENMRCKEDDMVKPALIEVGKEGIIRVMGVHMYAPASAVPEIPNVIRIEDENRVRYQDLNIYNFPTLNIEFEKNSDGLIKSIVIKNIRLTQYESNSMYAYCREILSEFQVEREDDRSADLANNLYKVIILKQCGFNYDMSKFPFAIIIKPTIQTGDMKSIQNIYGHKKEHKIELVAIKPKPQLSVPLKDIGKKVLQCLGTIVLSVIVATALMYLFVVITPWFLSFSKDQILLYICCNTGGLITLFYLISILFMIPMSYLTKNNKLSKIINAVILLYYGFYIVRLPWVLPIDFDFWQVLIALSLNIKALVVFGCLIYMPYAEE